MDPDGESALLLKLTTIVSAFMVLLLGCAEPLPAYRYKITVEIDTPKGVPASPAVREVRSFNQGEGFPGPEAGGVRKEIAGEAVALDLPNGETQFALLKGNDGPVDRVNMPLKWLWKRTREPCPKQRELFQRLGEHEICL